MEPNFVAEREFVNMGSWPSANRIYKTLDDGLALNMKALQQSQISLENFGSM